MEHHATGRIRPVLVVEDDPICRKHTIEALRQAGMAVKHTGRLSDALRLAQEWLPELIVTDLHLPDGDGTELARGVRAAWPDACAPPVIVAMTAADPRRFAAGPAGNAFAQILRKPFRAAQLTALAEGVRDAPLDGNANRPDGEWADPGRLLRRELQTGPPRLERLLETGRYDEAAALAHRLAGSAAVFGATDLGRSLQALSEACRDRPVAAELAEAFVTARRAACDLVAGTYEPDSG